MAESLIPRFIIDEISPWLEEDKILILRGARQVGKSTILNMLEDLIRTKYPDSVQKYFLLDFYIQEPYFKDSKLFLKYLDDQIGVVDEKAYIFIDEFQAIKDAGLFLKNLFDICKREKRNYQFIVSGSSSLEITKNTEFLTGRKVVFDINTISFIEFINYKLAKDFRTKITDDFASLSETWQLYGRELTTLFDEFLLWGAYPEVITQKDFARKKILLKEIIKTYIEKDIANFLRVENITAFNDLIKLLCEQPGSLINKFELSNTLNLNNQTLSKYIEILEGTFILNLLKPFSSNLRKELTKTPKAYLKDLGLINYYNNYTELPVNRGFLVENFVHNDLINKTNLKINHYRTLSGAEIDFVVSGENKKLLLMEVKYQNKIKAKSSRAMKIFADHYQSKKNIIVTKDKLELRPEENLLLIPAALLPFCQL